MPATNGLMPDAFRTVVLGMTQEELQRARPAAKAGFRDDNSGHAKVMFEKTGTPFIDQAIYLFDDARPVLVGVIFVRQPPARAMTHALAAFRAAVVKKWGLPDSIGLGRAESGAAEVALVWRRGDAVVVATCPASVGSPGAATTVRIGLHDSAGSMHAARLDAMDKAAQTALMAKLRAQLDAASAAPSFN
ncbi:hypothetical protein GJV26_25735 [Massilia dura]|uniref:Uncharacterized protein n=1 Tax=Pseudoduganella dura TaxID=321982 RepID=A0A6I3XN19_9BURK|nr:hypothetical protein [Pseudoduganella dura]MUI15833.1 hypothetical protein [Pseudoduganella dura]GGX89705.1 hypothetical protein GCM10007386_20710 [Pseudoduganella dura]